MYSAIRDIVGHPKVIGILGYGVEGRSTYRVLREAFPSKNMIIMDRSESVTVPEHKHTTITCGASYREALERCDIVFRSPGIALADSDYTSVVTSQLQLFTQLKREQIIGVTGTKGKSTTTAMIHHILSAKYKTALVGNIGVPALDTLQQDYDYYVCEYSCHQLSDMTVSPKYGVLLNFFPEHLDYYTSVEEYYNTKRNIYRYQEHVDHLYVTEQVDKMSNDLPGHAHVISEVKMNYSPFLYGQHNKVNQSIAAAVCKTLGMDDVEVEQQLQTFVGLPHRLELVHQTDAARFVNDSISTTPQSCLAGIRAYDDVSTVLIGGYDRGIDYSPLVEYLQGEGKELQTVFFGSVGQRVADQLSGVRQVFDNFASAVEYALKLHSKGTLLMSPAASSYDEFISFVQRGEKYRELVMQHVRP